MATEMRESVRKEIGEKKKKKKKKKKNPWKQVWSVESPSPPPCSIKNQASVHKGDSNTTVEQTQLPGGTQANNVGVQNSLEKTRTS